MSTATPKNETRIKASKNRLHLSLDGEEIDVAFHPSSSLLSPGGRAAVRIASDLLAQRVKSSKDSRK